MCAERTTLDISLVIPVYNGSRTIGLLVERITRVFAFTPFQIVLVNDGSEDDSEMVCVKLAEKFPQSATFVHLSRNFGEHSAGLAGLGHARGRYIAVLDDDGQNPPEEIVPMLQELKRKNYDVVYGHYIDKQHSWFRNAGSRFKDRIPFAVLARTLGWSKTGRDFPAAGGPPGFADYVFARTMALERGLLKKLSLPFGVALLAAATKRVVSRRQD